MKAGVLFAKSDIQYVDWEDPNTLPGTVKVRVHACGICGSDVPRVLGDEAHFYPIILGHEFAGEIADVGVGVTTHAVGDRVAGVPLIPCMHCDDCQQGQYAQCRHYGFIGSRQPGAFAEYVVIPAANAVKLPEGASYEMGALLEPASVALHGMLRAEYRGGADTAILGTGNIGILAMQWARIFGARRIVVFDIVPERLQLAKELGADAVFNPLDADCLQQAAEYTGGRGFPYVFETAGQPATIQLGFDLVANRGVHTCIGTPHKDFSFSWKQWELMNRKEFRLTGTWMSYSAPFPGQEWSLCAHCFANGSLRLHESMIYKRMPLATIAEAFELFKIPGLVKGKVLLTSGGRR